MQMAKTLFYQNCFSSEAKKTDGLVPKSSQTSQLTAFHNLYINIGKFTVVLSYETCIWA